MLAWHYSEKSAAAVYLGDSGVKPHITGSGGPRNHMKINPLWNKF
jgi:hypothetical protein